MSSIIDDAPAAYRDANSQRLHAFLRETDKPTPMFVLDDQALCCVAGALQAIIDAAKAHLETLPVDRLYYLLK